MQEQESRPMTYKNLPPPLYASHLKCWQNASRVSIYDPVSSARWYRKVARMATRMGFPIRLVVLPGAIDVYGKPLSLSYRAIFVHPDDLGRLVSVCSASSELLSKHDWDGNSFSPRETIELAMAKYYQPS